MDHLRDLHGGILPGPGKCHANVAVYGWTSRDARLVISRDSALKRSDSWVWSAPQLRGGAKIKEVTPGLCFFVSFLTWYIISIYQVSTLYILGPLGVLRIYINNCTYIIYIYKYVYTVYVCECVCVCARMCVRACVSLSRMVIILALYV